MHILAVCGIKNSGKTTLLSKITARLSSTGMKVAVIKHDGHSFQPDRPGTDSFRLKEAGAYGTAVFSADCFCLVKDTCSQISEETLFSFFPEADLILLEGFKFSRYPKIEVVRGAVSQSPASQGGNLLGVASDLPLDLPPGVRLFSLEDTEGICRFIQGLIQKGRI